MSQGRLWAIGLGLTCGIWMCGCQSGGGSGRGDARAPSFGVDHVPRQSEPAIEMADTGRRVVTASAETSANDDEEDEDDEGPSEPQGNLLTRLLPSRDRAAPERKPLPVSQRTSAASDDDDDSEF